MNIVDLIRRETAGLPAGKTAVQFEKGSLSYSSLFERVDAIALQLRGLGVEPTACVGLAFPDSVDYILLSLAVLSLDAVIVPVTVSSVREVAEEILEKTSAQFLISSTDLLSCGTGSTACLELPGSGGFFLTRCTPTVQLPDEFYEMKPAFIRFSSGTTGASKGVLLTHTAIAERTAAADQALQITSADTVLWVLSMSFHFVVSILLFLRRGATISLCSESFPFSFLSAVRRGDGTFIYATPFHYRTLIDSPEVRAESLTGIRMAVSTAMKLSSDVDASFRQKFGFGLTEAYGIIEVGLPFVNAADRRPPGSVGRASPGFDVEIRQADADGVGEVWLRGPGMYAAYLHPWQRCSADGWFATGDTGRLDANGFLTLLGRSKNLINFAGMKVFPYEVEAVLNRFPGVRASRVYPQAHSRYGQLPCAQVEASGISTDELQRFCYEHLESYKVPKKIELVERLERTASGKIKRIE